MAQAEAARELGIKENAFKAAHHRFRERLSREIWRRFPNSSGRMVEAEVRAEIACLMSLFAEGSRNLSAHVCPNHPVVSRSVSAAAAEFFMKQCDTCGGPLADGHPFALCPKCIFGEAIRSRVRAARPARQRNSALHRAMIFSEVTLLEKVAGGGQGEIWKTWDIEFHRSVAMKRIAEHTAADMPAVHRFLAEAQIASQLEHPGICRFLTWG